MRKGGKAKRLREEEFEFEEEKRRQQEKRLQRAGDNREQKRAQGFTQITVKRKMNRGEVYCGNPGSSEIEGEGGCPNIKRMSM